MSHTRHLPRVLRVFRAQRGAQCMHARWWLLSCVLLWACNGKAARFGDREHGPVGTLIGEIRLPHGARLPQYLSSDLLRRSLVEHTHAALPDECRAANDAALTPVHVTADGLLAGVIVAGSDFLRVRPLESQVHRVKIEHCRLQPSLIVGSLGDVVQLENLDSFAFEPRLGPSYRAQKLAHGDKRELPLTAAGLESLSCGLGAPCGRSDIVTFLHGVHAVTDATGHFRIEHFPARELVRINVWHPLFDVSESFVWLEPGQTSTVQLELTPKARFLPPSAAVDSAGQPAH